MTPDELGPPPERHAPESVAVVGDQGSSMQRPCRPAQVGKGSRRRRKGVSFLLGTVLRAARSRVLGGAAARKQGEEHQRRRQCSSTSDRSESGHYSAAS